VAGRRRPSPAWPVRRERVAYLDNLKVLPVAVIIAAHGVVGARTVACVDSLACVWSAGWLRVSVAAARCSTG
jgi:hypothetical protein